MPAAHGQQPLFKLCPRPAPLCQRAQDLLQHRELLIEGGQLCFQRLDAAPLRPDAGRDRGQLRRRKGARQREPTGCRQAAFAESGQVFQPFGDRAELSDEVLHQAGHHARCALLILSHRLVLSGKRGSACHHAIIPGRPAGNACCVIRSCRLWRAVSGVSLSRRCRAGSGMARSLPGPAGRARQRTGLGCALRRRGPRCRSARTPT